MIFATIVVVAAPNRTPNITGKSRLIIDSYSKGPTPGKLKTVSTNTAPEKDPMESAVEWSKLQNRNGDAYIPNTDKPYSGWAKQNYDNEQVKVLAKFSDGSVTHLKQWHENGIPKLDIGYSKGRVSLSDLPLESFWDLLLEE